MNQNLQGGKVVKTLGTYLYRHLDSSYDVKYSANTSNVYICIYVDNIQINLDIDIRTYSDKVRINLTEISPEEKTIGQIILSFKNKDMNEFLNLAYNKIIAKLNKYY